MKKLLLVLMPVFIATGLVNAQLQGYSWTFASSPFNSVQLFLLQPEVIR